MIKGRHILIINGPNLNLLGKREPGIYGGESFEGFFEHLVLQYPQLNLTYFQSNVEGEIIDKLHEHGFDGTAIILNAGGYTHTSVAIGDAVAAIESQVVELHISNVFAREEFRHTSYISKHAVGMIAGLGMKGYELAIRWFL